MDEETRSQVRRREGRVAMTIIITRGDETRGKRARSYSLSWPPGS